MNIDSEVNQLTLWHPLASIILIVSAMTGQVSGWSSIHCPEIARQSCKVSRGGSLKKSGQLLKYMYFLYVWSMKMDLYLYIYIVYLYIYIFMYLYLYLQFLGHARNLRPIPSCRVALGATSPGPWDLQRWKNPWEFICVYSWWFPQY